MKKNHIVLILVFGIAIAVLAGSFVNSGTMGTFADAIKNPKKIIRITGVLDKEQPIIYNPSENASLTQFTMIDANGTSNEVHLLKSKPQGLEQSESITIHGKMNDGLFEASDMQMKCPSKYNENKHMIPENAQN